MSVAQLNHNRPVAQAVVASCVLVVMSLCVSTVGAQEGFNAPQLSQQVIPILATSFDEKMRPVGVVAQLQITLERRTDQSGMSVTFATAPGRFSPATQVAIVAALLNVATFANLDTDSWNVSLAVPHQDVTVYGASLSAMVGLTVIALAQGHEVKPERVLTGTIEPDGHIGAVGGIALKLQAAHGKHLRLVLVPEEYVVTEGDWTTPFLLHVSPVGTVKRAYQALTDTDFPGKGRTDS